MPRRLDIGIASYNNVDKLRATVASIQAHSVTDWKLNIVDNNSDDVACRQFLHDIEFQDARVTVIRRSENGGYAHAVRIIQEIAQTEYIAYCDNDIQIQTHGWDEALCGYLDRYHEIGMVFPNGGCNPIQRPGYAEIMWGVGFCWVLSRMAQKEVGYFDAEIGHQNECDYCLRVRMAGWKCAGASDVVVSHHASQTNEQSPESIERISKGVVQFVNKWNAYFCGKNVNYFSPNVQRWEDWTPNALYMEEYWKLRIGGLNANPEVMNLEGRDYDLIRVPRFKGFYTGRII